MINEMKRLLEEKTFKSGEDMNKFYERIKEEKQLTLIYEQPLTKEDYVKCLILIANEVPVEEGIEYARKALSLDPDCIAAYGFLGAVEPDNKKKLILYQKGITIGKKKFGIEYIKENRGFFYTIPETIPFMDCLHFYGGTLAAMGRYKEATVIYEKILNLNVLDDMGVRHQLMLALIQTNDINKYKMYDERYIDEEHDWTLYTRVLFSFKTTGDSVISRDLLAKAIKKNEYIIQVLTSLPTQNRKPDMRNTKLIGAVIYDSLAKNVWIDTFGAINWLRKNNN